MFVTTLVGAGAIPDAITVPTPPYCATRKTNLCVCADECQPVCAARGHARSSSKGRTQITSGLKEGEHVVGDGSLFLQFKNSLQH